METITVEVLTQESGRDSNSENTKPSPAEQLKLDARCKDAALWTAPRKYPGLTPFFAFAQEFRTKSTISGPEPSVLDWVRINDVWAAMTPDERFPYLAQLDAQLARYRTEMNAFNARIPLSPLVDIHSAVDSGSDSSDTYRDGSPPVCRLLGGYGHCADHAPSQQQRKNRRTAQLWNRYRRDHPEACGGAVVPVPDQHFPFLHLPPELRTAVYCLILQRSKVLTQMEPDQSGPSDLDGDSDELIEPVDVRIFVVCKQIYEEATTVFFSHNRIRIKLVGSEYSRLPSPMFRTGFQPTDQALIGKLKKIDMKLTTERTCEWALRRVCQELARRARLKEIKVTAHEFADLGSEADKALDGLLEILTAVRGLNSVILNEPAPNDPYTFIGGIGGGPRMRIPGTAAQRDRVKRIMTTLD
ncbi:MAG: hypothetical protein Q9209_004734 [Squamulea sp. 1 TL-2023]